MKKGKLHLNSIDKYSKSPESRFSSPRLNSAINLKTYPKSNTSPNSETSNSHLNLFFKKPNRAAQTTIFIILAIIIITIAIVFYVKTYSQKQNLGREYFEKTGLQPSIKNIQNFVIECHEETSKSSLITIGIQGGYYNKPRYYFDMKSNFIPYYYYEGQILMPSKSTIENELSNYVDSNIESCLDKIKFQNFQLEYSKPKTRIIITPGKATFTTNLPVKIEHKGNKIDFELNKYPLDLNSSLNEIIEVAEYITNSHKENPELMCINCIAELAKERQLYVDFIAFQEDTTLVMLLENRTMSEPYIFEFLNKYKLENQS
ncbi:MAG: hypothetical protein AABW90_02020 [Nanoarchaeota archaeon]